MKYLKLFDNFSSEDTSRYNSLGKLISKNEEGIEKFHKWFGNSKSVDEKGRPLVLFHGTMNDFDEFSRKNKKHSRTTGGYQLSGSVFIFTDNSELASNYANVKKNSYYQPDSPLAKTDGWWTYPRENSIGSVLPVYLKIEKPLIISVAGMGPWYNYEKKLVERAKRGNYDGIIMKDAVDVPGTAGSWEAHEHTQYVVFSSNQIKSATGNNGNFDINNPSVLESISGGETPEIWYHGSSKDFDNFKLRSGTLLDYNYTNPIFLSSDRNFSEGYSGHLNPHLYTIKLKKGLKMFDFRVLPRDSELGDFEINGKKRTDYEYDYDLGLKLREHIDSLDEDVIGSYPGRVYNNITSGDYTCIERVWFYEWLKKEGFDGGYVMETGTLNCFVFKPDDLIIIEKQKLYDRILFKSFENVEYGFADAQRIDTITDFIKKMKENYELLVEWYEEEPDTDELLDPYDGYEYQTYIRIINPDTIVWYEGWSSLCWKALYLKPEYKGLSKKKALDKFLKERVPIIVKESGCELIDSGYEWYETTWKEEAEDGFVTFVKMKIKE